MLEEKILSTIQKYDLIKNGDNIVVGVSGGPDSMTLLNVLLNLKELKKYDINIVVAHINHKIRPEADEETKYVIDFCKRKNIECFVKAEKVEEMAKELKIGTEEAGRKLRYDFFEEVLIKSKSNKIATAHTANDNAETLLMNIIRGCGTSGLKGIEPMRDGKFIRPLIDCTRKEIEEYCEVNSLNPKFDKSNKENIYTRNKVRNMLIPYIEEEFNPNIVDSLNRLSKLALAENEYIVSEVENKYKYVLVEEYLGNKELEGKNTVILDVKRFNNQHTVIKSRLVLYTISKVLGNAQNIEKVHIEDIIKLCENNIGNKYLVPNKRIKIYINNGKIFFIKMI